MLRTCDRYDGGMPQPRQFSIKFLLTEMVLIAISLGLLRWFAVGFQGELTVFATIFRAVLFVALCSTVVAAFGGIYGYWLQGALWGLFLAIFWLSLQLSHR